MTISHKKAKTEKNKTTQKFYKKNTICRLQGCDLRKDQSVDFSVKPSKTLFSIHHFSKQNYSGGSLKGNNPTTQHPMTQKFRKLSRAINQRLIDPTLLDNPPKNLTSLERSTKKPITTAPHWSSLSCSYLPQPTTMQKDNHLGRKSSTLFRSRPSQPSMCKFLYQPRESTKVFKNEAFLTFFLRALYIVALVAKRKDPILIINTNNLAKPDFLTLFQKYLSRTPISCANSKWVGGTLTNWNQISKSIYSFVHFSNQYSQFLAENNIIYPRYVKMKNCFGGFLEKSEETTLTSEQNSIDFVAANLYKSVQSNKAGLQKSNNLTIVSSPTTPAGRTFSGKRKYGYPTKLDWEQGLQTRRKVRNPIFELKCKKKPALIFLLNPNENRSIIEEAQKLNIPVIALANTDTNLKGITYPIPTNNCSFQLLHFCLDWVHRLAKDRHGIQRLA